MAPLDDLIQVLENAGCDAEIQYYFNQESEETNKHFHYLAVIRY